MTDEIIKLKAELYDVNKQLALLGGYLQQFGVVLGFQEVQQMYDEIIRLKNLSEVPQEAE